MIKIKETKQADSRTADPEHIPSKEVLLKESQEHIQAVADTMDFFGNLLKLTGKRHDWTKIEYIDEFYDNFVSVLKDNSIEFKELGWWNKHLQERHHLDDRVPDDVNLIDVFEMVCDSVCAGLARSGHVRDINIPYEVLDKAVRNTAQLLQSVIVVEKEK